MGSMPILTLPGTAILSFLLALTLSAFTEEKREASFKKTRRPSPPCSSLSGSGEARDSYVAALPGAPGKRTPPGPGNSAKVGRPWYLTRRKVGT